MNETRLQKPGIEEWLTTAEAVINRLTDCVHVYKHPPEIGGFMPEAERQNKTHDTIKLLRRLHPLLDQATTPTDSIADAHNHDEQRVSALTVLFRDVLDHLPALSQDMQFLLHSPWMHKFPNKIAETLFAGETRDQSHGLGSGLPEHGRLAAAITQLMDREVMGDTRHPRQDLLRHGEPRRHDVEGRARWVEQNSHFLHTAGRVE